MEKREIVLEFIKKNGPSLPGQLYKEIGTDILIASAFLSELSINGHVKISSLKVGGSPLYYLPGQEHLLENFIEKLNEKSRKSVAMLKENLVLRDSSLEPVIRVAIREAKDFAKPLSVNEGEKKEIFWRWYLFNDQDLLKKKISEIINSEKRMKSQDLHQVPKPSDTKKDNENKISDKKPIKERQNTLQEEILSSQKKDITQGASTLKKQLNQQQTHSSKNPHDVDEFFDKIEKELIKNSINVLQHQKIKKGKDYNILLEIPSSMGRLKYFCKFLDKKRISEKDVSGAFAESQMRKLPVIIISTGELAKKAKILLEGEMHGISFKRINIEQ